MEAREPSRMPSPDPPNMTTGSNSYAAGVQSSPMAGMASSLPNNVHFSFNSLTPPSVPKPLGSPGALYHGDGSQGMNSGGGMLPMTEPVKKKRGRPRKYGPDGTMALALSPLSSVSGYSNSSMSEPSAKRRGRPPGSGKKQQMDALGSAGIAFTPHVITVKAGEDVASKIMAFSQQGSRTVCILSANGSISNVTLRQPATSGGTVTYEGRFEIISLSGSYLLTEDGGTRSRTGGLSVALAGSDGRVLGGVVAGMLMAAAPVQVVVGSFIAEGRKPKLEPIRRDPSTAPPQMPVLPLKREAPPVPLQMTGFGTASASSPPSQGTTSDDDSGSPNEHSGGATCNNNSSQLVQSVPPYASVGWPNSIIQHRHEPEVKMMN